MGLIAKLTGRKGRAGPQLDRDRSLRSKPFVNQLVKLEDAGDGKLLIAIPRKKTPTVKAISKFFKLPPYKTIELDELGSYTLSECSGENTVADMIERFGKKYRLNRREAEVSILTFLQMLAKRGIIGIAVPEASGDEKN